MIDEMRFQGSNLIIMVFKPRPSNKLLKGKVEGFQSRIEVEP